MGSEMCIRDRFKMVFDCLWVVVDVFEEVVQFFEVLVDGCRSFRLL